MKRWGEIKTERYGKEKERRVEPERDEGGRDVCSWVGSAE